MTRTSRHAAALALATSLALFPSTLQAAGPAVQVTADSFTVEQASGRAVFTGNVVITRDGLSMWAETVTVTYGSGGEGDIDRLEAVGRVRIKTTGQEATGNRAVFDPDAQTLRLSGDVSVVNAQGNVRGPELVIDLARETSVFRGSEGGRVTGVFTPK